MRKLFTLMLSLTCLLAFSIGGYSDTFTKSKSDTHIEKCVSIEKSIVTAKVIPMLNLSVDKTLNDIVVIKGSVAIETTDKVSLFKSNFKPDCIRSSWHYDLKRKLFYSNKLYYPDGPKIISYKGCTGPLYFIPEIKRC